MIATLEKHQTREEWLAARLTGIGGSDAAALMGVSPFKSCLQVWAEKRGIGEPIAETERMRWGHRHEPTIAAAFLEENPGAALIDHGDFTIARNTAHPYLYATLDREVRLPGRATPGVFEIKTTDARYARDWEDSVPRAYWVQVQHQMLVTGAGWGVLAVLIGGNDFRHFEIERDDAFCAELAARAATFWQQVESGEQPGDVGPNDAAVIAALYPHEQADKYVPLPPVAAQWDAELRQVKEQLGELEGEKKRLENELKLALGDAEGGTLPDGTQYTLKAQSRAGSLRVIPEYATRLSDAGIDYKETKASTFRVLRRKGAK